MRDSVKILSFPFLFFFKEFDEFKDRSEHEYFEVSFPYIELIEDKLRIFDNWTRIEILNFCILTLHGNTEKHLSTECIF